MKRITAKLLVIVGSALVALGRKLERPAPPPARFVALPRRAYRVVSSEPSRVTVIRLGLAILFSSARWGVLGV